MKTIGMVLGIIGLLAMVISPGLGLLAIVIGLLCFVSGSNAEKRTTEEQRHQQMMFAIQNQGNPNAVFPLSAEQQRLMDRARQYIERGNYEDGIAVYKAVNHPSALAEITKLQTPQPMKPIGTFTPPSDK